MKRRLALCLPVAPHDIEAAMHLAHLWADIEPAFNADVEVIIALRFDMQKEQIPDDVIKHLETKFFKVHVIVSNLKGVGFPHGCNSLEIGAYGWFVERARDGSIKADYMMIAESDTIPLRPTWLKEIIKEVYDAQAPIMGIWWSQGEGYPHINGNCLMHKDLWRQCTAIWQVPPYNGWDCYIAKTSLSIGKPSRLMWQDYHLGLPENPWKGDEFLFDFRQYKSPDNPLYGEKLQPAFLHGIKTLQGIDAVRKRYNLARRV